MPFCRVFRRFGDSGSSIKVWRNYPLSNMVIVTIIQFLIVVAVVYYIVVNMVDLVKVPSVAGPLYTSPFISVCVPARNEERDIGACLKSLLAQVYPHFEVIAIDDNSTDATGAIISALAAGNSRLTAIQGAPLPEGWLGKPYALHQACQKARGEYILFTDADPVFLPNALSSAMYTMQIRDIDVLTLMPGTEFGSFWERAIQPVIFGFIGTLTRFKKVNSLDSSSAMGVGAFMMFKKEVYAKVGGHERVRREIIEDVALARCVKMDGFKLLVADGKAIYSIRMYHSFREIWEGWRKNMFVAMRQSVLRTLYYGLVIVSFVVTPYWIFIQDLLLGSWPIVLSATALLFSLLTGIGLCTELRLNKRHVFLFPLGALVMSALMINSMAQALFKGRAEWRGRSCLLPEKQSTIY